MKNLLIFISIFALTSCSNPDDKEKNPSNNFKNYDLTNQNIKTFHLPDELIEISGLAYSNDGRLFAHNDEQGIVYQLNIENGDIIKSFSVGSNRVDKDFEDIAIVNEDFFLVTSSGVLYKFNEAENESYSDYQEYQTFLNSENDVEGLCYDSITNSLLLACKAEPGSGLSNVRAVYSFNLTTMELEPDPKFTISLENLGSIFGINSFNPSAIEFNQQTSTYFILSVNSIIEIAQNNAIISAGLLSPNFHRQAEGLIFLSDNTMVISDEGKTGSGTLTFYPPKQ